MTVNPETASLVTGAVGVALVAIDSIPAVKSIASRLSARGTRRGHEEVSQPYADEDGEASEESLRAFSDTWQRRAIAVVSVAGFAVSLALAIGITLNPSREYLVQAWLLSGVWILLLAQSVAFFTEPLPTQRFRLAAFGFWASLLAIVIPALDFAFFRSSNVPVSLDRLSTALVAGQGVAALLRGLACVLLPRRPDVFYDGKVVDQQGTVSLLGRYSFSWPMPLLQLARKQKRLELDQLPVLAFPYRSENLRAHFEEVHQGRKKLWKALIVAHGPAILLQISLTVAYCVLSFAPQIALYGILTAMEARSDDNVLQAWIWVVALGISLAVSSSIEAWLFWVVDSRVGTPIYAELSAVVFAKAMRRKDVKHTKKSRKDAAESSAQDAKSDDGEDGDEDEEEHLKKSRQSIINHAAVDARRIADFATFSFLIPSSLLRLIIACTLLVQLIGWQALLAGLSVVVLVLPVNIYAADKYTKSQDILMKYRDQKLAVVTEVLQGIRQIKFSALEEQWQKKISEIRSTELNALWMSFLYDVGLITIWILGPLALSAVSLAVYALLHGGLSASVAFTAMSVFGALELSLAVLPELISNLLEAKISCDRIEKFLATPDKVVNTVAADVIAFEDASVAWPADDNEENPEEERFVLRHLNITLPRKGLSVISGKTGSGKSLLLASILGECDVLSGVVKVPVPPPVEERFDHLANSNNWIIDDAIAYVAQIPWIENATIKDNILFGLPYDSTRYRNVLFACALEKDLDMLPDGELTDIGANGVNLSGGQRWRISFARALYSRAGILVMDDIFSALDAHTGRHVYEHALTGALGQNRTRILVTHHVALCLPRTDYSVLLEDGVAKHAGTIEDLKKTSSLADILRHEREAERADRVAEGDEEFLNGEETTLQKVISNTATRRRSSAVNGTAGGDSAAPPTNKNKSTPKKFVEDEKRESGSVKLSVYRKYFQKGGSIPYWLFIVMIYLVYVTLIVGRSWWVSIWTGSSRTQSQLDQYLSVMTHAGNHVTTIQKTPAGDDDLLFYLGTYVVISVIACFIGSYRYYLVLAAAVRAARNLFDGLTYAVLRAPLRWLDTVPLGRILNRFTADFHALDSRIGYEFGFFAYKILELAGIMVAGVLVTPLLLLFALILLGFCLRLALFFLVGAREIKRLESTAKSPVFEQFGSSLTGLVTVRAFCKAQTYINIVYQKINRHTQTRWYLCLFNRWLGFRMNLIGAFFSIITATVVVYLPGITASLAGFALSFALQYNSAVTFALRSYTSIELNMNSTERVIEYSEIEIENQGGADAPAAWPTEGRVEVQDLVVGYAPDLPAVLNGLSFTVEKNQRVGVVGRTGAGKSSLTLALFRFLEARSGQILIDGIDISKIKLHDLRSRLAIIPQDPVLFSGTVRSNLDPFDEYTDAELYDALERVHLISARENESLTSQSATPLHTGGAATPLGTGPATTTTAAAPPSSTVGSGRSVRSMTIKNLNIFTSLLSPISEGGLNLSQGQRQLLCLARAIVSRPKVMVLDEATSAVDMETDALIQTSIRAEFGRNATTLLVIAHRLSTIADFDRILVMDAGRAAEFGTPRELMDVEGGIFRSLVENSGEREVLEEIIFGKKG